MSLTWRPEGIRVGGRAEGWFSGSIWGALALPRTVPFPSGPPPFAFPRGHRDLASPRFLVEAFGGHVQAEGVLAGTGGGRGPNVLRRGPRSSRVATWLILPVVICLS
jgi:hypothetical protein